MKVVLNKGVMFNVSQEALGYLWEHHRQLFDEPIDPLDVMTPGSTRTFEEQYTWAVVRQGLAYFLDLRNTQLRALPWLVERVERGEEAGNELCVGQIEDGRDWYVYCEDDGSEWVMYADAAGAVRG